MTKYDTRSRLFTHNDLNSSLMIHNCHWNERLWTKPYKWFVSEKPQWKGLVGDDAHLYATLVRVVSNKGQCNSGNGRGRCLQPICRLHRIANRVRKYKSGKTTHKNNWIVWCFSKKIIFAFVFGWYFHTKYIHICIRFFCGQNTIRSPPKPVWFFLWFPNWQIMSFKNNCMLYDSLSLGFYRIQFKLIALSKHSHIWLFSTSALLTACPQHYRTSILAHFAATVCQICPK